MLEVIATADVAGESAAFIGSALRQTTARGNRASFAVSGGTTPWQALQKLATAQLDWPSIDIYQVDERVVPADSPDRNWRGLRESLLDRVPAVGHAMPVDETDLIRAAERYAMSLPANLDVVQLGLGSDGHTASLVPADPVCGVNDRAVAVTDPYQGSRRMSLTFPPINRASTIVWIVTGAAKQEALAKLIAGDRSIPAGCVERSNATVFADEAALGRQEL